MIPEAIGVNFPDINFSSRLVDRKTTVDERIMSRIVNATDKVHTITLPKPPHLGLTCFSPNFAKLLSSFTDKEHDQWNQLISTNLRSAFPRLTEEQADDWIALYCKEPIGEQTRNLLLFMDDTNLVGTTLFDTRTISYPDKQTIKGTYLLVRSVIPDLQGTGFGSYMSKTVIEQTEPDVLLTTCSQTASKDSWINSVRKGRIPGYDVFPYYNPENDTVTTLPDGLKPIVRTMFQQILLSAFDQNQAFIDAKIGQIDPHMIRRKSLGSKILYEHKPWRTTTVIENEGTNDTPDRMAEILNLQNNDQLLVVLTRKGSFDTK